jgi:NDP-sugar pyrophosphorylase family protein
MKALILAAGLGTRLLPFTKNTPKALFPVAGRPLLDIIILSLQNAGCKAIIVNTHHLSKKIDSYLLQHKYAIPVITRYEPKILGTGGAIKNVADFWDNDPFMVINSDIITDIDLKRVYDFHLNHSCPAPSLSPCFILEYSPTRRNRKTHLYRHTGSGPTGS